LIIQEITKEMTPRSKYGSETVTWYRYTNKLKQNHTNML